MNALEMRMRFQELINESTNNIEGRDSFIDSTTILKYLNDAQVEYIQKTYLSAPSFLERSKVIGNNLNDLRNIIKVIPLNAEESSTYYPYTASFRNSSYDVWHYIGVTGKLTRTFPYETIDTLIDLYPIDASEISKHYTTSINIPIILVPVYTQVNSTIGNSENNLSILVVYDKYTTFTTTYLTAHCLVRPKKISLDVQESDETFTCELADYLHEAIVRMAVNLYDQDKYKLSTKESK